MAKAKRSDQERFLMIRNRIADIIRNHGEDIEKGQFLKLPGVFVLEGEFLSKLVTFAHQQNPDLFKEYKSSLDALTEANEAAVTSDTAEYAAQ